jgi:hypothetical protein
LLARMKKPKGGRGKTSNSALPVLGITKIQSSRWQRAALVRAGHAERLVERTARSQTKRKPVHVSTKHP